MLAIDHHVAEIRGRPPKVGTGGGENHVSRQFNQFNYLSTNIVL